jgi:hypothetical protein
VGCGCELLFCRAVGYADYHAVGYAVCEVGCADYRAVGFDCDYGY